jgi:hypothetical protein
MVKSEFVDTVYFRLYTEMESALEEAELVRRPDEGYARLMTIVGQSIRQLKTLTELPFPDETKESAFFREVWPRFYSKLFYYQLVNGFELDRLGVAAETLLDLIRREERKIQLFFRKNREFWWDYRSGSAAITGQFTRRYSVSCLFDPLSQVLDSEWATIASYRVASGLAYELFLDYLQRATNSTEMAITRRYEWREGKTAAVEWIKAQAEAGSIYIDGKPATAVQLRADFEARFGEDLKDFDKLLYATDTRKKDATPYLTKLVNAFVGRKERLGK